jgi:amino acid adenylation domain-containing protein
VTDELLRRWNDTETPYPRDATVPELFERWAARRPDAPALRSDDRSLTYRQLDERANRLARHLHALGVGAGARVGLRMRTAVDWVSGALAVMKAGAAYVPLDPAYPAHRLAVMRADAGVTVVLGTGAADDTDAWVSLDALEETLAGYPSTPPARVDAPDDLAYVMFTSGSTGRPKGVGVTHRGIVRLVRDTDYVDIRPDDVVGQGADISFDAATLEAWLALLNGAQLVGIARDDVLVPQRLRRVLAEHAVTALFLATALMRQTALDAPDTFTPLRYLIFGGESADLDAVARVRTTCPDMELRNAYGPTENTVLSTTFDCGALTDADTTVPIGRPVANSQAYVLDGQLEPLPPGTTGELYVGGDGVACGYLGRPALTASRFVPDPFGRRPGGRLYRTGDLVRQRPDGVLEFVGRVDNQVKVRGFRVEPGEIEQCLRNGGVREVIVRADRDPLGDSRLVAYVVTGDGELDGLRAHARAHLPEHMVPAVFVALPRMPLRPNGKIDTDALPPAGSGRDGAIRTPPRTPTERALARIWQDLLFLDGVDAHDDFFALGGRSLKATRVRSRLSTVVGVDVPLRLVFDNRTLTGLAAAADRLAATAAPPQASTAAANTDRPGPHPLSAAQQRMWSMARLDPDAPTYDVRWRIDLEGDLDEAALRTALAALPRHHEALRSVFVPIDGVPHRLVRPVDSADLPLDEAGWERPFDLAEGPLARAVLSRVGDRHWRLLLRIHHIVCDAWSMRLIFDDLAAAYAAARAGQPFRPAVPRPGAGAAEPTGERRDALVAHWREALRDAPPRLDLPTDRPRPAVLDAAGAQLRFGWPAETAERVGRLARRHGLTPFTVFLAAFQLVLYRHSHQTDLVVGVPVAGRTRAEHEQAVGLFVNTLPLRARIGDTTTFTSLLEQARETSMAALEHQELPFDAMLDALGVARETGSQPLVQVMLDVGDGDAERLELPGVTARCVETHTGTAKFDLTLVLLPYADRIEGRLEYRTGLFDPARMRRFVAHLHTLLTTACEEPGRPIADLPMLGAAERSALTCWGDGPPATDDRRPVTELVAARARRSPDAFAVRFEERRLTYRQLDIAANRLAHLLVASGVRAETPVGVRLAAGVEWVVALLGVLRSGGVYVPLDPQLPAARLRHLTADAGVRVLLTDGPGGAPFDGVVVRMDDGDPAAGHPVNSPVVTVEPERAAYVIYTSGSTGAPKGVVGTHRGLRNLADVQAELVEVRPGDRVLQFHSSAFDVSLSEVLTTLCAGAELILVPRHARQPGAELARTLAVNGITVADLPPVVLGAMDPDALPQLRSLTVGGEACPPDIAAAWSREREFINAYGPTEATVTATAARQATGVFGPPIGRPVVGTRTYVLDARLNPVPVGVAGELYLGGAGVARGYLGDPVATARVFLPDPFATAPGQRMYRTGDIVRYRADGQLDFLGRADTQVKVRGYRIELGEIEARLRECPGVRQCAVVVREDRPGDRRLVAYLVGEPDGLTEVRYRLERDLPRYMVPAAFVYLPRLPLTVAGKLDAAALPPPVIEASRPGSTAAPRGATEETVAGVWREVLGLDGFGIHENFFDLGGNSMLLATMQERLNAASGVEVPAVELFRHPTVAMLARYLSTSDGAHPVAVEPQRRGADRRALAARGRRGR